MSKSYAKLTHSFGNFAKFVKNVLKNSKNSEIAEIMTQFCSGSRHATIALKTNFETSEFGQLIQEEIKVQQALPLK